MLFYDRMRVQGMRARGRRLRPRRFDCFVWFCSVCDWAGPHQPSHARRTHRHDNNCILVETMWEDNVLCGRRARLARWDAAHHTRRLRICLLVLRLAISARARRAAHSRVSGDRLATPHTAGPPGTSPRTSNFENCKLEMCVPSSPHTDAHTSTYSHTHTSTGTAPRETHFNFIEMSSTTGRISIS